MAAEQEQREKEVEARMAEIRELMAMLSPKVVCRVGKRQQQ